MPDTWFSVKEKFTAIALASQSLNIGLGLGYYLSPAVIENDYTKITTVNLIIAILLTVPFAICLLVIKNKPSNPPNFQAEQAELNEKLTLKEYFMQLVQLVQNKKYMVLSLLLSLVWANSYTLLSVLDYFLDNLPSTKIGILGLVFIAGGSLSDLIFSILIFKYQKSRYTLFNYSLKLLQGISLITIIIFCI
eukprot:TRINITY_DN9173_c0_g1_i1.p2 TRINITY_DN9173_c0_g1~~TRINITY_DN9173_c0_g1_i1.p2  ORF type:complete len:192 (+),score=12.21 TRINITY_DN9173_c0_g1_i1:350-925(+)